MHSKEFSIKFLTLLLSNRYIPGYEVESIDNDGKLDKNGLETYVAIIHEIATDMYNIKRVKQGNYVNGFQ